MSGRAGEAGEPGEPLLRGRDIFVLLLVGAGNHESGQVAPRQLFAKGGQPCGQRHAAFGFFERLEKGFEHRRATLGGGGKQRNPRKSLPVWDLVCLNCCTCVRRAGMTCGHRRLNQRYQGKLQGCLNSMTRGYTMPAFSFEKISPPVRRGPLAPVVTKQRGRHRPDPGPLRRGAREAGITWREGRHRPSRAEGAGIARMRPLPTVRPRRGLMLSPRWRSRPAFPPTPAQSARPAARRRDRIPDRE